MEAELGIQNRMGHGPHPRGPHALVREARGVN